MKHNKILLTLISFLALTPIILFVPSIGMAYPEGELYWRAEQCPDNSYLYDVSIPKSEGAVPAIDCACTQYSGNNGTYTGRVEIYEFSEYTEKGGWCINNHPYTGDVNGEYYKAYLYCNGVKRLLNDMSSCPSPNPSVHKNLGKRCKQDTPYFGNPINTSTGNKYHSETDLFPSAVPMALGFTRYYNSLAVDNDSLGYGWSHSYSMHLEFAASKIIAWRSDGRAIYFDKTSFDAESGEKEQLEQDGSNYRLTTPRQLEELYNASGQLISQSDRNSNTRTFSYTSGNLTTVTGSFGRTLVLAYNGDNRISSITDAAGKTVSYSYDTNSNLSSVTWPDGMSSVCQYGYQLKAGQIATSTR